MNIFLTGPANVGKTTMIKKIIKKKNFKPVEFYTQEIIRGNEVYGYEMVDYSNLSDTFEICIKDTPYYTRH